MDQQSQKHQDSPLMYCSYFTNGKQGAQERRRLISETDVHTDIIQKLFDAEKRQQFPTGTSKELEDFYVASDENQKAYFDLPAKKKLGESIIRSSFLVLKEFKGDNRVISFVIAHLDGILEDRRSRVKLFCNVQTDFKNQLDLIGILNSFLITCQDTTQLQKECASHVIAILFEEVEYQRYQKDADTFFDWLTSQRDLDRLEISITGYTFCLLTLLKTNQLAKKYSNPSSFNLIGKMLDGPCQRHAQVGYNVVCMLWTLSYHKFAMEFFEDYTHSLIEKVTKILDFFSWEKIARVILMLFDNLKEEPECQDHFSDIDAFQLIIKLQNRHWVDEDINKLLEKLFSYFDENAKVFSSIDKLKKQVTRKQLRWGPCHTEKFWQENINCFDQADNLAIIRYIVECLDSQNDMTKAVACFDLGEFAKFYHHGKEFLNKLDVKTKMAELMQANNVSAQVKKEAITCYQKLLMDSWSQSLDLKI